MVYAYSIGNSQRKSDEQTSVKVNPGPGAYSPSKQPRESSPKWKIGSSIRYDAVLGRNFNPGPGQYENIEYLDSKKEKSPGFIFGVKSAAKLLNPEFPGPGSYENGNRVGQGAPAFSLAGRHVSDSNLHPNPGPGCYEVKDIVNFGRRAIKIGTSKRDGMGSPQGRSSPGPGRYSPNSPTIEKQSPKYTFGGKERDQTQQNLGTTSSLTNLGPGSYDLGSTIRTDRGNTIAAKFPNVSSLLKAGELPGPGAYTINISQVKRSLPAYKIGSQERSASPNNEIPGPGSYLPELKQVLTGSPNYTIGSSNRADLSQKNNGPGPAQYNQTSYDLASSPKYSIVTRNEKSPNSISRSTSPGPDSYRVKVDMIKERPLTYKIGKSQRDHFQIGKTPGPGTYSNTINSFGHTTSSQFSFGKESKIKQPQGGQNPGPGQYNLKTFVNDFPTFVIPPKANNVA